MKKKQYRVTLTFFQEAIDDDDPMDWDWIDLLGSSMPVICESSEVIGEIEACDNCGYVSEIEEPQAAKEVVICHICKFDVGPSDQYELMRHKQTCPFYSPYMKM